MWAGRLRNRRAGWCGHQHAAQPRLNFAHQLRRRLARRVRMQRHLRTRCPLESPPPLSVLLLWVVFLVGRRGSQGEYIPRTRSTPNAS